MHEWNENRSKRCAKHFASLPDGATRLNSSHNRAHPKHEEIVFNLLYYCHRCVCVWVCVCFCVSCSHFSFSFAFFRSAWINDRNTVVQAWRRDVNECCELHSIAVQSLCSPREYCCHSFNHSLFVSVLQDIETLASKWFAKNRLKKTVSQSYCLLIGSCAQQVRNFVHTVPQPYSVDGSHRTPTKPKKKPC